MTTSEPATRTAVVTGGSGGIGVACAEALIARGYDVVLTARSEKRLKETAQRLGARWVAADAAEPADLVRVMAAVEHVDLLVHSAGILKGTFVRKERIEDFDEVIRANLRSAFVTTQAALTKMSVGGRIVFISSSAGPEPMKARSAYSASKAGLNAFAHALSREVARDGINVNVLIPAPVETGMLEEVTFEMVALQAKDVADALVFLDQLDPRVVVPELAMHAMPEGPLAPPPLAPEASKRPRS
jgi:NAD(P)-dependent dehydrogenase (short-subunit alcohol dehydrogenase family)